ncbi:opacity protein-like surface antigen [Sinobacterium caligoides]|uniref:Opacity protein-like surface antigen n=1 Tax=Sinobacterium caligoides TaxID=933926 RepID=A0A3N2DKD5_9GAMM|nr:outer membrane beta-barrel protein [Sinobacterium caligoides]ROS00270.1 opacity protein-like surface antigen [Sinobacterium caligoides]
MNKLFAALVIPTSLLVSATAFAKEPSFYASAAISYADQDYNFENINNYDYSDKAVGFNLTAGYQFNDYFSLEASYYDFGKAEAEHNPGPYLTYKGEAKASALGLAAVASYPVNDSFRVYGKLGAAYFTSDVSETTQIHVEDEFSFKNSDKDSGFAPYFGAGVALNVTGSSEVYLESSKFSYEASSDMGDYDHDVINTSLGYRMFF